MAGRKSQYEEIKIKARFLALAPKYFEVLKEFLDSPSKEDRKFAMQCLSKTYPKMIPQEVNTEHSGSVQVEIVNYGENKEKERPKVVNHHPV